mgnify:CR=1 FL=1
MASKIKHICTTVIEECQFEKLSDYLRSENMPDIEGQDLPELISIEEIDGKMIKIIKKALPISKMGKVFLGATHALLTYEIIYDENCIMTRTVHPPLLEKYFQYEEILTIKKLNNTEVEINRDVKTTNLVAFIPSYFTGSIEDLFHENCYIHMRAILNLCK